MLPQGYVKSLDLCHDTVCRDLHNIDTQQNITLGYYIDDMLIGSGEQEVTSTLDALVRMKVLGDG